MSIKCISSIAGLFLCMSFLASCGNEAERTGRILRNQQILLKLGNQSLRDLPENDKIEAAEAIYEYVAKDFKMGQFFSDMCHISGLAARSAQGTSEECQEIQGQCLQKVKESEEAFNKLRKKLEGNKKSNVAHIKNAAYSGKEFVNCMNIVEEGLSKLRKISCSETPQNLEKMAKEHITNQEKLIACGAMIIVKSIPMEKDIPSSEKYPFPDKY